LSISLSFKRELFILHRVTNGKGYGFLVLVIAVAIGTIVSLIFGNIGSTEDMGAAIGAIISVGVIWLIGTKLNSSAKARTMIDKQIRTRSCFQTKSFLIFY